MIASKGMDVYENINILKLMKQMWTSIWFRCAHRAWQFLSWSRLLTNTLIEQDSFEVIFSFYGHTFYIIRSTVDKTTLSAKKKQSSTGSLADWRFLFYLVDYNYSPYCRRTFPFFPITTKGTRRVLQVGRECSFLLGT